MRYFTTRKLLLAGVLFIVGTAATPAQEIHCKAEPTPPCPSGGVTATIIGPALPPPGAFTIRAQGPAIANSSGNFCCGAPAAHAGWIGNGSDPTLGTMSWSFDVSLEAPPSMLTPNNEGGGCLPATGNLYFWIKGTISSFRGKTFRSTTWIQVRNNNILTCNPFVCVMFNLVNGPITFTDLTGPPGNVAFTLTNLTVGLNP